MAKSPKSIEKDCQKAYETSGFGAVCDLVNGKFADYACITWGHCSGCDCEAPSIDGSCLACGSSVK